MFGNWITHFEGDIEGRPVKIETHSEGGFRVGTDQGGDDLGSIHTKEGSTLIMPPTEQGRRINVDGVTMDEIREQLLGEGFSNEATDQILSHFPSNSNG